MFNWSEFHFSEVTSYKIHTLVNIWQDEDGGNIKSMICQTQFCGNFRHWIHPEQLHLSGSFDLEWKNFF